MTRRTSRNTNVAMVLDDFEAVARGLYLEGLAVDQACGTVWYSDVIAGGVYGLAADGATASFATERRWIGGVLLASDGRVLASGPGGIAWGDPKTEKSGWLLDSIGGERLLGVNEMAADSHGSLFFGTVDIPAIERGETPGAAAIYRLDPDGEVTCLVDGLTFSNGLALSADEETLFHNESFVGTFAYDVRPDRTLGPARKLIAKEDCDGLALDGQGNLWITGFRSSEITVLRSDGTLVCIIPTPAAAITQIRFAGSDLRSVYFTEVPVEAGDGLAEGKLPDEQRSVLWRARSTVAGAVLPVHNVARGR